MTKDVMRSVIRHRKQQEKPMRSREEYRRRFFPKASQMRRRVTDPTELGIVLANEAFERARPVLNDIK
jgi:hypothetical protein